MVGLNAESPQYLENGNDTVELAILCGELAPGKILFSEVTDVAILPFKSCQNNTELVGSVNVWKWPVMVSTFEPSAAIGCLSDDHRSGMRENSRPKPASQSRR